MENKFLAELSVHASSQWYDVNDGRTEAYNY